jgi:hypothetical protein
MPARIRNALLSVKDMRDSVEAFVADINIEQTTIPSDRTGCQTGKLGQIYEL